MVAIDVNANTSVVLSKRFKAETHALSIFIPILIYIIPAMFSIGSVSFREILLFPALFGVYTFLYYLLAGGMEWNTREMSFGRKWSFLVLSIFIVGLLYLGIWYVIRLFMAKRYQVPMEAAKGHLLTIRWKALQSVIFGIDKIIGKVVVPKLQVANTDAVRLENAGERFTEAKPSGQTCAKCGISTAIGQEYTVKLGRYKSSSSGYEYGRQVLTTSYNIIDSENIYLCNKCVEKSTTRKIWGSRGILIQLLIPALCALAIAVLFYLVTGSTAIHHWDYPAMSRMSHLRYPRIRLELSPIFIIVFILVGIFINSKRRQWEFQPIGAFAKARNIEQNGRRLVVQMRIQDWRWRGIGAIFWEPGNGEKILPFVGIGTGLFALGLSIAIAAAGIMIIRVLDDPNLLWVIVPFFFFFPVGSSIDVIRRPRNRATKYMGWAGLVISVIVIIVMLVKA